MLKTELSIETIGEPNIQALNESEQHIFFETLFNSIINLYSLKFSLYSKNVRIAFKVSYRKKLLKYKFDIELYV